ncbi:hypothetical protein [Shewanella sp.]|uniref:hypothetical protein n=1 Tax=Shewanella sp. TaxID=50422 RepID=UPI003A976176
MSQHAEALARLHLRPSFNSAISLAACFAETKPTKKPSREAIARGQRLRAIEHHQERRALAQQLGMTMAELGEAGL